MITKRIQVPLQVITVDFSATIYDSTVHFEFDDGSCAVLAFQQFHSLRQHFWKIKMIET